MTLRPNSVWLFVVSKWSARVGYATSFNVKVTLIVPIVILPWSAFDIVFRNEHKAKSCLADAKEASAAPAMRVLATVL